MRLITIIALLASAAACNDGDIIAPLPAPAVPPRIDGPFAAKLSGLTIACKNDAGETSESGDVPDHLLQLDVLATPDGGYALRHDDSWLPGYDGQGMVSLGAFAIDGDAADFAGTDAVNDESFTMNGSISANLLSLDFTDSFRLDGQLDCVSTAHAEGVRMPITDPDAIDGYYEAVAKVGDYGCPVPDSVNRTSFVPLTAAENFDGNAEIGIDTMRFDTPLFGLGAIAYTGRLTAPDANPHSSVMNGNVAGSYGNGQLSLHISYAAQQSKEGCGGRTVVSAAKRLPSRTTIGMNDYGLAMQVNASAECAGVATGTRYSQVRVSRNPLDESVYLMDGDYARDVRITPDSAGAFHADDEKTVLGRAVSYGYDGIITPDGLQMTVTVTSGSADAPCVVTVTADGLPRYRND